MPETANLSDSESGTGSPYDNENKSDSSDNSGSDSDSGSSSSSSDSSASDSNKASAPSSSSPATSISPNAKTKHNNSTDDPSDLYGIRRSGRSRKEPERLNQDDETPEKSQQSKSRQYNSWNYDDDSSSASDDEKKQAVQPSKRLNAVRRDTRRPPPQKPTKKRSSYSSDESSLDTDDEKKRVASRRSAAATVSYKEASEDEKTDSEDLVEVEYMETEVPVETEKCETIEKILAQRRGKIGVTGNITTCYAVEENGDPNAGCDPTDLEHTELQYQIKWKDWAHIHNTWESEQSLREQKVKGLKKLENYVKRETELSIWRDHATPEDIDYYECQLELQQELLKSYNNVERIIAKYEKPDGSSDYYLKWESLPYSDATWEDSSLIQRKWPEKISEFRDREDSKRTPSKHCKVLKYRPKFHEVKSQPSYMGANKNLILRDYQMHGLNWMIHSWCKENSVILADEMGLGKTIQTICFLYYLFHTHQLCGPFLCVVPLSTMTS